MKAGLCIPFTLIALLLGTIPAFAGERLAVVIGVNDYDMLAKLNGAVNDAERISAYYSNMGFRVWTLTDRQELGMNKPSLSNFERVLGNLSSVAQETPVDELIFFFAGHGVQIAGTNFLCFPETQPTTRTGMVSVDSKLVPWLRDMKARLSMVYLDACRNDLGPVRAAGIERGIEVVGVDRAKMGKDPTGQDRSMAVFYASKSGEFSYEKPDGSGGFFTDTLLEALNADTTTNIGELFNYVRQTLPTKTEAAYGQMQVPRLGGDVDLAALFTKGKVDSALLDTGGRLYVEASLPGAEVWVNGIKKGASPLFIDGLSPGSALVEAKFPGYYASNQVTVVRRTLGQVKLEMKEIRGNVLLASLSLAATGSGANKEDPNVVLAKMKILVDGVPAGDLSGTLISNLPTGAHTVALASPSWYWEQSLDVKGNDTAKVTAVFAPVGNVGWKLPESATVTLVSKSSGQEFLMDGTEGTAEYLPSGEYQVKYRGEPYVPLDTVMTLTQGTTAQLSPELKMTERWQAKLEVTRLGREIEVKSRDLTVARAGRGEFDTVGWVSLVTGLGLAGGSAVCYGLAADSYTKYQATQVTAEATALRSSTKSMANLGFWLGVSGGGVLAGSLTTFLLGPQPGAIEKSLKDLDESLAKARKTAGLL